MDFIATTTFMAEGKQILRGSIIKGKVVAKWMNYRSLEDAGYIRKIETPTE
jgi:hypothetical protein